MREDTGLLISTPVEGVGYQSAGALQRLGRRMTGILQSGSDMARLRHVPMPTVRFPWSQAGAALDAWPSRADSFQVLLVSPEPELGGAQPLSDARAERVENLIHTVRRFQPELRVLYVLPETLTSPQIDRFRRAAPGSTVLLVPAIFGFRDQGLLDGALAASVRNPSLLSRPPFDASEDTPVLFAGDIASFVADAAARTDLRDLILSVPPTTRSLTEWTRAFRESFGVPSPTLRQRVAGFAGGRWTPLQTLHRGVPVAAARPALDWFPTLLTPLARSMREIGAHHRRAADIQLVFPPGRSI